VQVEWDEAKRELGKHGIERHDPDHLDKKGNEA